MLFNDKKVTDEEVNKVYDRIDDINHQIKIIDEKLDKFVTFRMILVDYGFDNITKERAKEIVEKLEYLREEYKKELNISETTLKELMGKCEHDMEFLWSDSHHDYYRCTKCGFEKRI